MCALFNSNAHRIGVPSLKNDRNFLKVKGLGFACMCIYDFFLSVAGGVEVRA